MCIQMAILGDGQLFLCLKRNFETSRILESVWTIDLSVLKLGYLDVTIGHLNSKIVLFFISFPKTPILSQSDT
jgi:hypothetical protein